ncbi:MAG: hypothetical protein IJO51_08400 [Clostridia bacterium]|nr:hypothetical protein [Clostridia bacterium]MBQ2326954.1 hypothetical protein [Clostridia bacterium]MBQ3062377.1 hypothetical protein [Clostridia bacterium]MBQ9926023.1 hypothetical protein [Clostridia bacterium]MBQ9966470.1 hypothetical protein [Clostridia bacterium]
MMEKMFETAVRQKYRYPFKGMISTEDLWDLSLANLDAVFKVLNAEKKQSEEESLLSVKSDKDTALDNKIAIVRYIVSVKLDEREKAAKAAEVKAQREKILSIMANKQEADLANKSIEELKAMLEELK